MMIASRLIEARTMSGLSQGQASRVSGIDRQRIAAMEDGSTVPSPAETTVLADIYDVREDWLADGVDQYVDSAPFAGLAPSDVAKLMRLVNITRRR